MKRFEYLEKTCNASSFYECVGEKLMTQKECASNGVPCTRYSFPNNKPPLCQESFINGTCNLKRRHIVSAMEKCLGQKPCSSEEYEFHLGKDWSARDPSRAQNILQKILGNQTLLNMILHTKYFLGWLLHKKGYM